MAISTSNAPIPFFVANQVLTANDLNNLVSYLDSQLRLTRALTVGIGIISGFRWELNYDNDLNIQSVTISSGYGISSDGYLFQLEACTLDYIASMQVSDAIFKNCEFATDTGEEVVEELINVCELKSEEELTLGEADGTFKLIEETEGVQTTCFANKVLVLLWEELQVPRSICFNDCAQPGSDKYFQVRKLLVDKDKMCEILTDASGDTGDGISNLNFTPLPFIHRFGKDDSDSVNLCNITSWEQFYSTYRTIAELAIPNIAAVYKDALEKFGRTSQGGGFDSTEFDNVGNLLLSFLNQYYPTIADSGQRVEHCDIQYIYDFFKDLVLAYYEFESIACDVNVTGSLSGSNVNLCLFPGFLSLGYPNHIIESGVEDDGCRTNFQSSSLQSESLSALRLAAGLFARMVRLVEEDNGDFRNVILPVEDSAARAGIKVTPSLGKGVNLSDRAIPFYYDVPRVRLEWNPRFSENGKYTRIPSYFPLAGNPPPFDDHKLYDIDKYEFFRAEGHVGDQLYDAIMGYRNLIEQYNYPFDVQAIHLGPVFEAYTPVQGGMQDPNEVWTLMSEDLDLIYFNAATDLKCKAQQLVLEGQGNEDALEALVVYLQSSLDANEEGNSPFTYFYNSFDGTSGFEILFNNAFEFNSALGQCYFEEFAELRATYATRISELVDSFSFPKYAKNHPGMEHAGGVMKGGTLVLVYINAFLDGARENLPIEPINSETDEQLLIRIKESLDDGSANSAVLPFLETYVESKVVADFCLPYLCCGDTPVIKQEIKQVEPTIDIVKQDICHNENPVVLTIFPGGGFMNTELPYLDEVDGEFRFIPNGVPLSEFDANGIAALTLEYILGGRLVSTEVEVYLPPVADIVMTRLDTPLPSESDLDPCAIPGYRYRFENVSQNWEDGFWRVNGVDTEITPDANTPLEMDIRYDDGEPLTVELIVSRQEDVCPPDTDTVTVDLCSEVPPNDLAFQYRIGEQGDTVEIGAIEIGEDPMVIGFGEEAAGTKIFVNPLTPGGTFHLFDETNPDEDFALDAQVFEINQDCATDFRYCIILPTIEEGERVRYQLTYGFGACGDRTVFTIQITDAEIVIEPRVFCEDDDPVIFEVPGDPANLQTTPNVVYLESGQPTFNPGGVTNFDGNGMAVVTITYNTPDDDPTLTADPVEVRVFRRPVVSFDEVITPLFGDDTDPCRILGYTYQLTFNGQFATTVRWLDENNTELAVGQTTSFNVLFEGGPLNIILEASNDICQPVTLPITLNPCDNINGPITFDVEGVDSNFTTEGGNSVLLLEAESLPQSFEIIPAPVGGVLRVVSSPAGGVSPEELITPIGESCEARRYTFSLIDAQELSSTLEYRLTYGFEDCNNLTGLIIIRIEEGGTPEPLASPNNGDGSNEPESNPTIVVAETGGGAAVDNRSARSRSASGGSLAILLNQRMNDYSAKMEVLSEDRKLAALKTFKLAHISLAFRGKEAALNGRYNEVISTIMNAAKRAKGKRLEQYTQLLIVSMQSYMDKLLAEVGGEFGEETKALVKSSAEHMKSLDIKLTQFKRSWKGKDLKQFMDSRSVDKLSRLLK